MKYDTQEGIKEYLTNGIQGFNLLLSDRHNQAHKRPWPDLERLNEWFVLSRYRLDCFGQLWVITEIQDKTTHKYLDINEFFNNFSSVIPIDSFNECISDNFWITTSMTRVPGDLDECNICGEHWTLEDMHTAEWDSYNEEWNHKRCSYLKTRKSHLDHFKMAFDHAGYRCCDFTPTKNEYHNKDGLNEDDGCEPWYLVDIPGVLNFIKIGWRKNVINIDWSWNGAVINFPEENVTQNDHLIHAYGYDKMGEYLKKIIPNLIKDK